MNSNQKKILIAAIVLFVVGTAVWFFTRIPKDSCEYSESLYISDRFMAPFLASETSLDWFPNYYTCHQVQKGDLVLYELGNAPVQKFVRIATATGDDIINLRGDADNRGWNLLVNENMVMNGEKPYVFGIPKVNPVINLYLNKGQKKLLPDELILFATVPPGNSDSGLYGVFSTRAAIKGRVFLPKKSEPEYVTYFTNMYSESAGKEALANSALLPENQLAKVPSVPSHQPVAPIKKKPSPRKTKKGR